MADPRSAPEPLLTIEAVCAVCRVSDKTVRRWIQTQALPAARLGNQLRIRPRDLDIFIRDRLTR